MVTITKDGEMTFSVQSNGDSVDVDIDDGSVQLTLPDSGARKFGEELLKEADKSAE